ncbi:hypothetical protein AJ78_02842 [Emergomyces pasteurianus Ep9510]|uniref:Uncharacterized protein n=1 Tax=Emergomyces pasteurianus Ep9510 TaxID=1447872 RepID=A0A1J9QLI5_9EURO|nr:hypothetical protein AJ78_02842 [Emergomyces pasteurianus Ep9510]
MPAPTLKGFIIAPRACIVRDHSSAFDATQEEISRDYLLRSEQLTVSHLDLVPSDEPDGLTSSGGPSPSGLQPIGNAPNTHLDTEGGKQLIFCPPELAKELAMRGKT